MTMALGTEEWGVGVRGVRKGEFGVVLGGRKRNSPK